MCADELVCASVCGGQRLGLLLGCFPLCVLRGDLSLKPELAVLARPAGRQAQDCCLHVSQSWCYT